MFRSQNPDQGATTRIRPASRKYAAKRMRVRNEMSASGLHAREAVDSRRHVAIVPGFGLQFEKYRQRP